MDTKARHLMTRARTALVLESPFFGSLALRLGLVESSDVETCAVDGKSLFYNPAWVSSLPAPVLKAVYAHEVFHCAAGHPWRRGSRDFPEWNIAADMPINGILREQGFTLPDGALFPPAGADLSAEEFYAKRGKAKPGKPGGNRAQSPSKAGKGSTGDKGKASPQNGDCGGCGNVRDAPPAGKGAKPGAGADADEWRIATINAAKAAERAGKLPGALKRIVGESVRPRVDWRAALREFCAQTARADYDWRRPSRRYSGCGVILPSLRSEELKGLAVVIDVSGSVPAEVIAAGLAEIESIRAQYSAAVRILATDTRVTFDKTYSAEDPLPREFPGGGGTNFCELFATLSDYSAESEPPALCVFFSDLVARFPDREPDFPVLWIATESPRPGRPPWGQVVRYYDVE